MEKRYKTADYFTLPESTRPSELIYGMVREPPAPLYGHQRAVGQLFLLLHRHVADRCLGEVCISPVDVVLDQDAALVVQPDIVFVSAKRRSIVHDRIWGAPDMVVEVASAATEDHDRTAKLAWYRQYGVRECWFVYPAAKRIEVVTCPSGIATSFTGTQRLRSAVLPEFEATAAECFP